MTFFMNDAQVMHPPKGGIFIDRKEKAWAG